MPLDITIDGLDDLMDRINNAAANVQAVVDAELRDGAEAIARDAKNNAPGDKSVLRNRIAALPAGPLNYEVVSGALYSAYVEFGTGDSVSIPTGYEDYAEQFKGKNQEHKGMVARAFFIPAFMKNSPIIIKNITKILDKALA